MQDEATTAEAVRLRRRPDNELPGSVAVDAVLATSEDLVIFIGGLSVYRHGVDLTVEVRARPGRLDARPEGLLAEVGGHGLGWDPLLPGVEFSDGRRSQLRQPQDVPGGRPRHLEGTTSAAVGERNW